MTAALRFLLSLLLVVALVVGVAPFTDFGTRQLLAALDRYTPLEVGYAGGRLGGRLQLSHVALATGAVTLRVEDLEAHLKVGCLWRSALCFHRLQAQRLDLSIPAGEEGGEPLTSTDEPSGKSLQLPVQVETEQLVLQSATINWPGGQWQQGLLEASIRVGGDSIEVLQAVARDGRLSLAQSDTAPTGEPLSLPELNLPLRLAVDDLRLATPSFDVAGVAQTLDYLQLRGRWRQHQFEVAEFAAAAPERGTITANGEITFTGDWPVQVTSRVTLAQAPDWAAPLGSSVALAVTGDLDDLRLRAEASGRVGLALEARLRALQAELPFELDAVADWQGPLVLAELLPLSGPAAELQFVSPLRLAAAGTLAQQSFELEGVANGLGYEQMSLRLAGTQRERRLLLEQVLLRDSAGDNHLSAAGELSLTDAPQWSFRVDSDGVDLPSLTGYAAGRLQGSLQLSGEAGADYWRLAVSGADIRGEVNGLPATLSGYAALDSDLRFGASDLAGDVNGALLTLRSGGGAAAPGLLELRVQELGRWLPGARGVVTLEASTPGLGERIEIKGSAGSLEFGELSIDSGALSGHYHPTGGQQFDARAEFSGLSLQGVGLDSLRLEARGDADRQSARLLMTGDVGGELAVDGGRNQQEWRGSLAATTITTPQGPWELREPVDLNWPAEAGAGFRVAGHCWEGQGTRLCPGELVIAERSSGSLTLVGDMGFLAALFPDEVEVDGSLDLALEFAWGGAEQPVLEGYSDSRDVRIIRRFSADEAVAITWERAAARLERRPDALYLEGELVDEGSRKIALALRLPADGAGGALQGTVQFDRLQLATLAPLVPRLSTLEGELRGSVRLAGTVEAPLGEGTVTLTGGRISLVGNPTELASLDLSVELQGRRAVLAGRGLLGGGEVKLDGLLLLAPSLRLEMAVSGSRQQLLAPPATELLVSEELQVVLTEGLLEVTGEVVVHEGTLRHEELPEGSVAVSDRVVVVDYAGNVIREDRPFDTRLNVRVLIEDSYEVEGGGLRATVGGNLRVVQEPGRPLQLYGNLNLVRGELSAYRQRLRISRGTISFAGNPNNPELDVRAEREIRGDNVTVGVELRGTLEEPVMTVYSDPPMEQSEAMSYLIRGRGLDTGAAPDGTALALAVGADAVNQSGVLSGFDRLPGISQIQLGSEGTAEETAATVGGYIGERLYFSYGIGIYEPITVLTARLYLTAQLWLEVVSRLENSVDLYYSFKIR